MCLRHPVCERGAVEWTPKNGYPSRAIFRLLCPMVYSNKSYTQTQRNYRTLFKYVAPQLNDLQPTIIKMVHQHIGDCMFVAFSMKHFQTGGLEGMGQFLGHHVHQISLPWTSFYGAILKITFIKHRYGILLT